MNFNPYIYIIYHQSNLLNYRPPTPVSYPYKMKYFICYAPVTHTLTDPADGT